MGVCRLKKTIQKQRQLRFDEINQLVKEIGADSVEEYEALPIEEKRRRKQRFWDCLWDWLLDGWAAGLLFVGEDKDLPDITRILNWVYPRGETTSDIYDKDITDREKLQRMIEAEANRCFNSGVIEAVRGVKGVMKTWETMGDERVRETHEYLEGMTIPFDEEFVTIGGDSAMAPGMFSDAENNVNCRCWISATKDNQTEQIQ